MQISHHGKNSLPQATDARRRADFITDEQPVFISAIEYLLKENSRCGALRHISFRHDLVDQDTTAIAPY
jgi:hypothetical protein